MFLCVSTSQVGVTSNDRFGRLSSEYSQLTPAISPCPMEWAVRLADYVHRKVCTAWPRRCCSAASFLQFRLLVYSKCTQNTVIGRGQYSSRLVLSLCVHHRRLRPYQTLARSAGTVSSVYTTSTEPNTIPVVTQHKPNIPRSSKFRTGTKKRFCGLWLFCDWGPGYRSVITELSKILRSFSKKS